MNKIEIGKKLNQINPDCLTVDQVYQLWNAICYLYQLFPENVMDMVCKDTKFKMWRMIIPITYPYPSDDILSRADRIITILIQQSQEQKLVIKI